MPCGGIYPVSDAPVHPCWYCNELGADHFLEEWDSVIHKDCIAEFLKTEEGQIVVNHNHHIQIGDVVLQKEGESTIMDPDQCLKELREAIAELKHEISEGFAGDLGDAADKAVEKFEALDGWLSRGGFLPLAWGKYNNGRVRT